LRDVKSENEYKQISKYITEISGIVIPPEKYYLIETRLYRLMLESGVETFDAFYKKVIQPGNPLISQKIINAITVNETLWFRDAVLWKCFERDILPGLIEQLMSGKKAKIRIWSAAASTGQEAYSIVMCIDNYLKRNNIRDVTLTDFEILATDISDRVLDIATSGRYDKISMTRGITDHYKAAYFKNHGSAWDIDPQIKSAVDFKCFNLKNSYTGFGMFDVIFCRYVLIYFPNELKSEIILKMHDALNNDGVLFTGNYVLYNLLRDVFTAKEYGNLTYYIKSRPAEESVKDELSPHKFVPPQAAEWSQ